VAQPSPSPPHEARANDLALAAFVLGLVSVPFYLYGIVAIAAIVVGIVGVRKPPRDPRTLLLAGAGIAFGTISFLMGLVSLGVGP
jgi:hypothetical protein